MKKFIGVLVGVLISIFHFLLIYVKSLKIKSNKKINLFEFFINLFFRVLFLLLFFFIWYKLTDSYIYFLVGFIGIKLTMLLSLIFRFLK